METETLDKKEQAKAKNKTTTSLIESMFEVGAHYGYSRSRRHPSFAPYIFGTKNKSDVIDLEKTGSHLAKALMFIKEAVANNKTILFVGTKPEARKVVEETAISLDVPRVVNRWIGGLLTNFSEMKKRVKILGDWLSKAERGELDVYTKKERAHIDKEIRELTRDFGGIANMVRLPHILFVVDSRHEKTAIAEAKKKGITIVALTGTDCDIRDIDYPIPANDSNVKSIAFFVEKVAAAYTEGLKNQKSEATSDAKTEMKEEVKKED